jgi:hypothetical protein
MLLGSFHSQGDSENEQLGTPLCRSSPSTIIQVELESCEVGDSVARLPNMKFNWPLPFSSAGAEIHSASPVYEFPATRALRPTAYVLSTDLAHPDQSAMLGSSWTKGTAFAHLCARHWFGCLNRETVVLFSEVHRSEGLFLARLR